MKRIILACALLALLLPALALAAARMPQATPALYIAMLYEKLTGKTGKAPDFEEWVKNWKKFKDADFAARQEIMTAKLAELNNAYNLITYAEPIVVKAKVKISGYSPMGRGFLVQNFNEMTFFTYSYMGKNYALIPSGMADYQWLKAPPTLADLVMRETKNGHEAIVTLTLISMKADPKPMVMGRRAYRLLLAEISKIEMWSRDGQNIIWDSQIGSADKTHKDVMNLRQQ